MSIENVTRENIIVKPGQVWRDLDKRVKRTVTVESVSAGVAKVISTNGARSRIRVSRMHKHGQGFELVTPAPGDE